MTEETTPNPRAKRGPAQRLNLPLTKQATDQIKAKARLYPGQQGDFIVRLAKRYEAEHLAADLMEIVNEKEAERRQELGLGSAEPVTLTIQGD